jgi:hypothetical protein
MCIQTTGEVTVARKAVPIAKMPLSRALDGTKIEFAFRDMRGRDYLFVCNPGAAADIVAGIAKGVREAAEQRHAKSPTGQRIALASPVSGGGVSPTPAGTVILTLELARGGFLEFELPPATAQHLSVLFGIAVAKIPPKGKPN